MSGQRTVQRMRWRHEGDEPRAPRSRAATSHPYRTAVEVIPVEGDWTTQLELLDKRRRMRAQLRPRDTTIAQPSRTAAPDDVFVVECDRAPTTRDGARVTLSTRWLHRAGAPEPPKFKEIQAAHANCVGWLYAMTQPDTTESNGAELADSLATMMQVLGAAHGHVVIIGPAGFRRPLTESRPMLQQLLAHARSRSPLRRQEAALLASRCLQALGWRGKAVGATHSVAQQPT